MRFFVPLSNDVNHAEHLYEKVRDRVAQMKEAPAARRIYILKFDDEGKRRTIAVGDEFHKLGDGPIIAIFQGNSTSTYYVCTPKHGAFEGEPYQIENDAAIEVEEFSAVR
jgi:hypothetical protein